MYLKKSCVLITFALLFFSVLTCNYLAFNSGYSLFSFHPSLMSVGWLLMTLALFTFSNFLVLERRLNYEEKKKIHWILQSFAFICVVFGFVVIVINKNISDKPHFQTWHSLFGLVSAVSCIPSLILGITYSYSSLLREFISPSLCKQLHSLFGVVTYLLLSFTVFLSTWSIWISNSELTFLQLNIMKVVIIFCTVVVVQKPVYNLTKRMIV